LTTEDFEVFRNLGTNAARQIIERYTSVRSVPRTISWDGHRWIRFRLTMGALEDYLRALRTSFMEVDDNDKTFENMMMRGSDEDPDAFHWMNMAQRNHALRMTSQLLDLIDRWQKDRYSLSSGHMPEPRSRLKMEPDI
jgi:hypothetical protein